MLCMVFVCMFVLQMSWRSSHRKKPMVGIPFSLASKRTRQASATFDHKIFKNSIQLPIIQLSLQECSYFGGKGCEVWNSGINFIPIIFANKDWAPLFGMFDESIEELIREFYSNAWFTGVELKCWVRGKDFIIIPDYLVKILQMNHA